MGRVADWLFGTVTAPVTAAGTVQLAPTSTVAPHGWGTGGDLLAPVTWAGPAASPWWDRDAAMSIPTISRARDLICSAVGALPLTLYRVNFGTAPPVEQSVPPAPWMDRPDPNTTRQWLLSWTTDDLLFYGYAYWRVTDRYRATGYPAAFARCLPGDVTVADDGTVTINGETGIDPANVVEFRSPIAGVLATGYRAISIALQLDDAAERFAGAEVPAGILEEQAGGEDLSDERLAELAAMFTQARRTNTTAATNKYLRYRESTSDPERMQLVAARGYQALEMARLANVPPYLVGAPAGTGMTYQNAEQARGDLIDFGALPYIGCIEQTLGGPNVTPRGQTVRLDANAWLRNPFSASNAPSPNDLEQAFNEPSPA